MALIKLGSVVTQISGKIGGQTFGTGPAGSYMKNSGRPRKATTESQKRAMSTMATTAQQWRKLTQARRDLYNSASPQYPYINKVGEVKHYSGFAIFAQIKQYGGGLVGGRQGDPLPKYTFQQIGETSISKQGAEILFYVEDPQPNTTYNLYIGRPSSVGVSAAYQNQFYVHQFNTLSLDPYSYDLQPALTDKFGTLPASWRAYYHIDAIETATGQVLKSIYSGVANV